MAAVGTESVRRCREPLSVKAVAVGWKQLQSGGREILSLLIDSGVGFLSPLVKYLAATEDGGWRMWPGLVGGRSVGGGLAMAVSLILAHVPTGLSGCLSWDL
ncbi:hypothetical protein FPQ18DRAFT_82760 [Pyronema domesticum]|nr:hypothetical protein FPQ18DRAFT_82760 [Pyronema domesticum]